MKNNQFKSLINNKIKHEAQLFDFEVFSVDHTNNQRIIYVYTLDYKCVGIFDLWLNNDYVHLSFTTQVEKSLITAKESDIKTNYAHLFEILEYIVKCFSIMDENNP